MRKQVFVQGFVLSALIVLGALTGVARAQNTQSVVATPGDYQLNPGDIIQISVWKEPDLQRDVLIRPDGKFSFPLTGDVMAAGHSIDEVREMVSDKLSRYIPDLVVSVSVQQINGNRVYVIGQVNKPGEYVANPPINVMQALAIAGGGNAFADLNDITILRRTQDGMISLDFNYKAVAAGKKLEQNIMLQAGDVVVVP